MLYICGICLYFLEEFGACFGLVRIFGWEGNIIFIISDVLVDCRRLPHHDMKGDARMLPPGSTSLRLEVKTIEHEWQNPFINILTSIHQNSEKLRCFWILSMLSSFYVYPKELLEHLHVINTQPINMHRYTVILQSKCKCQFSYDNNFKISVEYFFW